MNLQVILNQVDAIEKYGVNTLCFFNDPTEFKFVEIIRSLIQRLQEAEEIIQQAIEPSLSFDTMMKGAAYLDKYKGQKK